MARVKGFIARIIRSGHASSFHFLTMSKKSSYLKRLPAHAQKKGSNDKGEAEIATRRRDIEEIESECADELSGSALGKGGKRLGILLEDEVRMIVRDPVRYPSGKAKCQMRIIGKTEYDGVNGVVVLPRLEGRFVLRQIYRHATRSWELEVVRGRRETGQTSRQAARKEIKQELGYSLKKLHPLGRVCPDSAIMSSVLDIFLGDLSAGARHDDPEPTEAFGEIVQLTSEEMAEHILKGKIRDSYTIAALTLAQLRGLLHPISSLNSGPPA
jgi:ADP-ribose pyrophosphatase